MINFKKILQTGNLNVLLSVAYIVTAYLLAGDQH